MTDFFCEGITGGAGIELVGAVTTRLPEATVSVWCVKVCEVSASAKTELNNCSNKVKTLKFALFSFAAFLWGVAARFLGMSTERRRRKT